MPYHLNRQDACYAVRQGDQDLIFRLKWPEPVIIRNYFRSVKPVFRAQGRDIVFTENNQNIVYARDLLVDHLVSVTTPDGKRLETGIEEIREALRKPQAERLINVVVNRSLFSVEVMESDEPQESGGVNFEELLGAQPVLLQMVEWDPVQQVNIQYQIRVTMSEPTLEQHRQYEGARPIVRKAGRRSKLEQEENVSVIWNLFKDRVRSIENATFDLPQLEDVADAVVADGCECSEDNREKWVDLVPYHIASTVMSEDAGRAELGND